MLSPAAMMLVAATLGGLSQSPGTAAQAAVPPPASRSERQQGQDSETAAAVSARASEYWKLKQQKNLSGMYDLYASAYRAAHPREEFMGLIRLVRFPIVDFKVTNVAFDQGQGRAKVTVHYTILAPPLPQPVQADVTDDWVLEAGRWYKADEPVLLPFPKGQEPASAQRH